MSLISINKLTFGYDGSSDNIFEDISFGIDTDWRLGFCGRNGRGKTTFLRLLMGELEYRGTISASVTFDYFPMNVADMSKTTIDILEGVAPGAELWQIQKELYKLSLSEDALYRAFDTLSNGERTKALLAGLFLRQSNFLLIDEPTNHLDMESRRVVAHYLKSKSGFVLVSHDRTFLDECVNHILSINKSGIEVISGNFSAWYEQKQLRDAHESSTNEKLSKEIGRLKTAAKRSADWANKAESSKIGIDPNKVDNKMGHRANQGAKSKKMMAQSKAIKQRIQSGIRQKSELLKDIEDTAELRLEPLVYHSERLVSLNNISVSYDARQILDGLSLNLQGGSRIALTGSNGSGKSSILKLISGYDIPHTGQLHIGSRLIISYVSQDASYLSGSLSDYIKQYNIDQTLYRSMLHKLDFVSAHFDKDMSRFSAGQKKKIMLARSLCECAHVYIWDEPLNYIDIISRIQIEELILAYKPTMIFVEHDKTFVDKVATEVVPLG